MPNVLQFLLNNAQFLLFILVFLAPMFAAVWRWVETQRERRRLQTELERRRLEALRTGRVEGASSPASGSAAAAPAPAPTGPTREEVAARRQREMQERLRQRLEQQRRAGSPGAPPTRTPGPARPSPARTPPPTTARPTTVPGRSFPPPPARSPRPADRPRPVQRQPRPESPAAAAARRQRVVPVSPSLSPAVEPAPGAGVASEEIGSAREAAGLHTAGPAVRIRPGLSVQQLREAVILREVLDKPLALRERGTDLFD